MKISFREHTLFGTLVSSLAILAAIVSPNATAYAQTGTVLYNFAGVKAHDGSSPVGSLVFDKAGNLYGTTASGGNFNGYCTPFGCGTAFQLSPLSGGGWNESVIHIFGGRTKFAKGDGARPESGVVFDSLGNLYGTTVTGGAGAGTAFQLSPEAGGVWKERLVHAFDNKVLDGDTPWASPVLDVAGNVYGTTQGGGSFPGVFGTVFEITRTPTGGKEAVLYKFPGGSAGADPQGGVVFDATGNLYGTTVNGGDVSKCSALSQQGCGVVFELSPTSSGWQETVLHTFSGGSDGAASQTNLILDAAGNLYGTTTYGGNLDGTACFSTGTGCGVVFELSRNSTGGWDETVLYSFTGADGGYPLAGLLLDSSGNLYGTTFRGGNLSGCLGTGCGVVFELSPTSSGSWKETILHKFGTTGRDGTLPEGGLILDAAGNLYGTTTSGGTNGQGTVFKITP